MNGRSFTDEDFFGAMAEVGLTFNQEEQKRIVEEPKEDEE